MTNKRKQRVTDLRGKSVSLHELKPPSGITTWR